MTPLRLVFTVFGRPAPAGSKRAFAIRRGGKVTGVAVTEDSKRSRPWQALVKDAAAGALDGRAPMAGPLALELDFYVARPAGHYGSGRNAQIVKPSAPRFPDVRPDTTKLIRGVEDALTGLVWRDDAQIVVQVARKRYGIPERCEVTVDLADAAAVVPSLGSEGLFA